MSYEYGHNGTNFDVVIKNNSDMLYKSVLLAYLYEKQGNSYSSSDWHYDWNENHNNGYLTAGETATYHLQFSNGLTAGKSYRIDLLYTPDFASLYTGDFIPFETSFFTVDSEGKTTGIEDIENDKNSHAANAPYYTLDGMILKEKPVKKGIYIHNGKKVVIK